MEFNKDFEEFKRDLFSLPWLVNGSLNEDEASKLKKAVEKSPELQTELDFLMSMRTQVKKSAQQNNVPDIAWQRLSRDIKAQPKLGKPNRFSSFSRKLSSHAAVAATLVLGVYLTNDYVGTNQDGYFDPLFSDQQSSETFNQVQIVIRFNAQMSRLEIDELLQEHQLMLVSGPSSVNLYHVRSSQNQDFDELLKKLRTLNSQIEYVQINE